MKNTISRNNLADKITSNPTISSNPLYAEIIRGMYQGKPLLGPNGLLTDIMVWTYPIYGIDRKDYPSNYRMIECSILLELNTNLRQQ